MDSDNATLSVGFAIEVGSGSFEELFRLQELMNSTEMKTMLAAKNIEVATSGMINLNRATASMTAFGNAATRELRNVARDAANTEKAGERMVAQLERANAAYGKSRSELRAMRAEELAAAADRVKNSDLAERIRAQEQALYDKEFAAMRQAKAAAEELAAAKVIEAQQTEREAAAIRDATEAHRLFEAVAKQRMASFRASEAEQAAAATAAETARVREAAQAYQLFEAAARRGAVAMREAEAAAARDAAMLARIRELLDPAAASQDRLNQEIEEARRVMTAAGLGAEEMARAEALIVQRGGAVINSAGAQRAGFQQLSMNLGDVATSYAGGMRAGQIFAQQSGQIVQAISLIAGESKGLIGILAGPWGIALTAAITLGVAFAGSLGEAKTKAEQEAEALKTAKGATEALDEATGRLHKSKQQQIDDSNRASQALLKEALAMRTRLQAQSDSVRQQANDPLTQAAGGIGAAGAINARWVAQNDAEIKRLQASLGGVGFAEAVERASAATNKAAKATQEYEAYIARVQAAWERSGKTARDQALVQRLVADAMRRRDAATKTLGGTAMGMADADARVASAANGVQLAEGRLAQVRAQAARDLAAHTITQAEATSRIAAAREELNRARDAQRGHTQAVRDAIKEEKALSDLHETVIAEHGKMLADLTERMSKPTQAEPFSWFTDSYSRAIDQMNAYFQANGFGAEMEKQQKALADAGEAVKRYADAFGSSFGHVGDAISEVTEALIDQAAKRRAIADLIAVKGAQDRAVANATAQNEIGTYAAITGAAKSMFSERSRIYKSLQAAETVFRAVQLAMSIRAMIQDTAETVARVANAGAQATAEGTAGVAAQSKLPFPANIAAMAATAAALAAVGVAIVGSLGGKGGGAAAYAKGNTGTGTVLGDASAKSESIKNAIDALKQVDDATLTVNRDMLQSLRSIESSLGGVASQIVRAGNVNADGSVSTGFNKNIIGDALSGLDKVPVFGIAGAILGPILSKLFGTKTSIVGSGIYGGSQSLEDILSGGFDGSTYSDVQKKKKLFGLTTSTKYSTTYGDLDPSLENQFTLILRQFYSAIDAAAGPLGAATTDVEDRLNSFVVNIGKIDLKGLTGQEIQDKLAAVFGAAADQMAAAAIPGLDRFTKVGEGAFETLVRVASTVEQVDAVFQRLGVTTGSMGIDIDMAVSGMFDSVSDFASAANAYFETYYSEAEQAAAKTAQLARAFGSLGVAMPDTLAGFRQLVESQDLTSDAGREVYATLLQLAPAFADLKTKMDGVKSAADVLSERQGLERQLLELQGDTAALRALDLAKIDASNRALQQNVWALQDQQEAAKSAADEAAKAAQAADQLRQAWASVGSSITDEIKRIRGITDEAAGNSFASLLGQFNAANSAARGGDIDAAKSLPALSKALLDAAADVATSQQEWLRVQAQTANQLEDTLAMIGGASPSGNQAAWFAAAANSSSASTNDNDIPARLDALAAAIDQMRTENNDGNAAIAGNTGSMKRTLDNVTRNSGGDAVSTVAA